MQYLTRGELQQDESLRTYFQNLMNDPKKREQYVDYVTKVFVNKLEGFLASESMVRRTAEAELSAEASMQPVERVSESVYRFSSDQIDQQVKKYASFYQPQIRPLILAGLDQC